MRSPFATLFFLFKGKIRLFFNGKIIRINHDRIKFKVQLRTLLLFFSSLEYWNFIYENFCTFPFSAFRQKIHLPNSGKKIHPEVAHSFSFFSQTTQNFFKGSISFFEAISQEENVFILEKIL